MRINNNRHNSRRHSPLNGQGFTIIELLIATTVLSVILVMVTVMMIGIGQLYYKGINQARIQDNARSITDEISQRLKLTTKETPVSALNAADPSGISPDHVHAICIDKTRYTYRLGQQIGGDTTLTPPQSPHVLWRDTITATPAGCTVDDNSLSSSLPSGGTELIAPNSRLTAFSVTCNSDHRCVVAVGVAYGDSDLLTAPPYSTSTHCVGGTGQQFCATASLTTTVVQRLQ